MTTGTVSLSTPSPDPHAVRLPEGGDALTYSSTNAMLRAMRDPALIPLHVRRDDGTFAARPDRFLFSLRDGHPHASRRLPDWVLADVFARPGAEVWAPEIWPVDDAEGPFFLLLATMRRKDGRLVTTAFTAPALEGPWTGVDGRTDAERRAGAPLREGLLFEDDAVGLIDCTYFRHPETGRTYLLWKEDGNDVGRPCRLLFCEAKITRRRIERVGTEVVAAVNDPESWQGDVLEGAAFFHDPVSRNTWIVVSGNDCYGPKYAMGAMLVDLRSEVPSFHMLPDPIVDNTHPLLVSRGEVGAGHPSIRSLGGLRFEIAFHVWKKSARMGVECDDRQARSAPFSMVDGVPTVADARPTARNVAFVRARSGRQPHGA